MFLCKALKALRNKQYSKIKLQDNEVFLPSTISMLSWFGLDFGHVNYKLLLIFSLIQLFSIFGELYSIHHRWGTISMLDSIPTAIYGIRCMLSVVDLTANTINFKYICQVFSAEIWVKENEEQRLNCEKRLFLPRLVCYNNMATALAYMIQPTLQLLSFASAYESKEYALSVQYPFETRRPVIHEITYLLVNVGISVRTAVNANLHLMINYFVFYTSYRFEEIKKMLLESTSQDFSLAKEVHRENVRSAIESQQMLIRFSNKLEEVFSLSVFTQFTSDSLAVCIVGVVMMLVESSVLIYCKNFLCLATLFAQEYVNCVSGELLIQASAEVGDAVYMSNWQDHDPTDSSISLIIQRSRKALKLTGLGFFDMSLTTFATVCQRSMSYFTILKTFFE